MTVFELQSKPKVAAARKGRVKQGWLDPIMVEPNPYLRHDGGELGGGAPKFNNVHLALPLSGITLKDLRSSALYRHSRRSHPGSPIRTGVEDYAGLRPEFG